MLSKAQKNANMVISLFGVVSAVKSLQCWRLYRLVYIDGNVFSIATVEKVAAAPGGVFITDDKKLIRT